jgi:micrococcal nuclease
MRHVWRCVLILALATVSVTYAQVRDLVGAPFDAKVVSIIDGDTVDVIRTTDKRTVRIRLDGIDAPERGEPFSDVAARTARVLLFDQSARIQGRDVDRYGRLVARISVRGQDASVQLVRAGVACHYTKYSSDAVLARAETDARREGRGFWATGAPKPRCTTVTSSALALAGGSGQNGNSNGTIFHGNTSSRVYHSASCRNYNCRNCTRIFHSEAEAQAAGFTPAGDCLHR